MGSMLQVLDLPSMQMQLGGILSVQAGTQQVKVVNHRQGKMYASQLKMNDAWDRFIDFHQWHIAKSNTRTHHITMESGAVISFHYFTKYEDVYKISGIPFCMVDVDMDITDLGILNYIKTRLRCPH